MHLDPFNSRNINIMAQKIITCDKSKFDPNIAYLGCASKYVNIPNKGQGDPEEGLYARIRKDNVSTLKEEQNKYKENLLIIPNGDFIDLKLKTTMNMPFYCCYGLRPTDCVISKTPYIQPYINSLNIDDMFKNIIKGIPIPNVYEITYEKEISKQIFDDFRTSNQEPLHSIIFLHPNLIKNDIVDFLKIPSSECLYRHIKYIPRQNTEWYCPEEHPNELFYKEKSLYSHQHELRFVITSRENCFTDYTKEVKKIRFKKSISNAGIIFEANQEQKKMGFRATTLNISY